MLIGALHGCSRTSTNLWQNGAMPSIDEGAKAWQQQMAKRAGLAINARRRSLGFTAQQLSEQTKSLGYPVSRAAIAKIESNSRSGKLDVAELLVLSAALFTPPVALVFPGPYNDEIDILPSLKALQFDAAQWFSGLHNETFGTQAEGLDSARALVENAEKSALEVARRAITAALEQVGALERRIAAGEAEQTRLIAGQRSPADDA